MMRREGDIAPVRAISPAEGDEVTAAMMDTGAIMIAGTIVMTVDMIIAIGMMIEGIAIVIIAIIGSLTARDGTSRQTVPARRGGLTVIAATTAVEAGSYITAPSKGDVARRTGERFGLNADHQFDRPASFIRGAGAIGWRPQPENARSSLIAT